MNSDNLVYKILVGLCFYFGWKTDSTAMKIILLFAGLAGVKRYLDEHKDKDIGL